MSSSASDLSNAQYGYDMVVAVTQSAVNATMQQWLDQVDQPPFIMGYTYDPDAPDPTNPYVAIPDWSAFVADLGFDPFDVPNGTDESDPQVQALMAAYFAFGFQTQIGLPPVDLSDLPDVIVMDKSGSTVTYNMTNKSFSVIGIQSPAYGPKTWLNASQSSDDLWTFGFTVDLDLRSDNINNHFSSLPPDTQKTIKNLGEDMFSVQQLFLDLNTAALSDSHTITGLDPTSTIYQMLTSAFFTEYFTALTASGGVMLGYSVTSSQPFSDTVSLIPTDLNFEVCAYQESGKPTDDYSAYTLNYLIMSDGHTMPAPVPFQWNWVDKTELSQEAGVMSINRDNFRDFLNSQLGPALSGLAMKPDCSFSINLIKATIGTSFSQDSASQSFDAQDSGGTLLTWSYESKDEDSDTFVPNWGNWSVDYTASCTVSASGTTLTAVAKVNAKCHLNIEGGVTEGNWASYEITTDYTLGTDSSGRLTVTASDPSVVDKSEKPDPNWWSTLVSAGTIDDCVDSIQGYLQPLLEGFGTGMEGSIATMLNGSAGWVFPGGETYSFTGASFSDNQDLVATLLYVTPTD